MTALILTIFLASLVGSVHCVGMCGAFAALAVGDSRGWATMGAYHAGRLASYLAIGALAGAAGQLLDVAGAWQRPARHPSPRDTQAADSPRRGRGDHG